MKKTPFLTILCLALCLVFIAGGCARGGHEEAPTEAPTGIPTEAPTPAPTEVPTEAPTEVPTETPVPAPTKEPLPDGVPENVSDFTREQVLEAQRIMDQLVDYIYAHPIPCDSAAHPFVPADKYAELTEAEKLIYDDMLTAARGFLRYSVLAESNEQVQAASAALFWDHPEIEIYFVMDEGENADADIKRELGEVGWHSKIITPQSRFFNEAEDMDAVKDQVEAFNVVGAYVASRVPEDLSAIDKYRLLAYYISVKSQYAYVNGFYPLYSMTAYGAVIRGYSICQGYAIGFEYLCRMADLDCRRVRNKYNDDNMHFWDLVTIDGGTYFVDVTWSDGSVNHYTQHGWFEWFFFTRDREHVPNDGTTTTGKPLDRRSWE
ncbi:MAG: hypothetical protein K6G56_01855 [Clostridiales bacterium]|nr:hypothetical protein [Clostridiales bacterium]